MNEEPEIIGHLDKSVVNGGELIPGQKSGVVPVAVDKKGLLKKIPERFPQRTLKH